MAEADWRDHSEPVRNASPTEDLLSGASVLVVDDEIGMRNFLVKTLTPACAFVAEASTTVEASQQLDKHRFDVVILDNVMPGQSGVDWLAEQHRIGFFSDAILITAFADLETAIAALRAGAFDFLLKPFRSSQIRRNRVQVCSRIQADRASGADAPCTVDHETLGLERSFRSRVSQGEIVKTQIFPTLLKESHKLSVTFARRVAEGDGVGKRRYFVSLRIQDPLHILLGDPQVARHLCDQEFVELVGPANHRNAQQDGHQDDKRQ